MSSAFLSDCCCVNPLKYSTAIPTQIWVDNPVVFKLSTPSRLRV